ncbi:MAG: hypothetical protein MK077_10455, partial [Phycisphaerales bacterium]|nr:hypothetical protein [Phycisphaerales bacterium]
GAETRVNMSRSWLHLSESRFGTFYWDATDATEAGGYCNFYRCSFRLNNTAHTFGGTNNFPAGGVAWVDGSIPGDRPLICFSDCGAEQNNGNAAGVYGYQANGDGGFMSVASNWHPYCRIAQAWITTPWFMDPITDLPLTLPGDVNGDGQIDEFDLEYLMYVLGTCHYDGDQDGMITINDLLDAVAVYGSLCQ